MISPRVLNSLGVVNFAQASLMENKSETLISSSFLKFVVLWIALTQVQLLAVFSTYKFQILQCSADLIIKSIIMHNYSCRESFPYTDSVLHGFTLIPQNEEIRAKWIFIIALLYKQWLKIFQYKIEKPIAKVLYYFHQSTMCMCLLERHTHTIKEMSPIILK